VQVFVLTEVGYFDGGRIFDLSGRPVGAAGLSEAAVTSALFPDLSVPLVELFAE